ncbi:MAG: hypothetical protein MZV63_66120 [Marinilabiliales bacterium]|nr:hypothetical protein [Marinilabiliales bacterium]
MLLSTSGAEDRFGARRTAADVSSHDVSMAKTSTSRPAFRRLSYQKSRNPSGKSGDTPLASRGMSPASSGTRGASKIGNRYHVPHLIANFLAFFATLPAGPA